MKNKSKISEFGLSYKNINIITILIFALLLLFGPIEPYGILIRTLYLIIIPILVYIFLKHFGQKIKINKKLDDYLNRAIFICVAGGLLIGAYFSITTKYHTECNQYVNTRDGRECVGDYIQVKGIDSEGALIQIILAGLAIWISIKKRKNIVRF